jgi:glycosyltransferase involved in cell wall biosynthesis
MRKKKILIDINSIVPLYVRGFLSGIGRTTLELVKALAEIKADLPFEIVLYSQNMKGTGKKNLKDIPFEKWHLYLPHREKYNRSLQKFPIREIFTNYDLLHVPHNFEYVYCPGKTIVSLHDALFMKAPEGAFDHARMAQVVPSFTQKVKTVITCSEHSKNDIVETMAVNPEKIHVIPWGIQHDLFFPEKDKNTLKFDLKNKFNLTNPYFLSVSCNEERKNTPRLIDCYIQLAKTNPTNDLCMLWNAPEHIRKKVKDSGFQDKIHFLQPVSDVNLRLLYAGATVTVYPSLYEGFGLPVLESMACGTPVICSNTTSLPEVGGDAAVYIDPLDNQSLFDALNAFEKNTYDQLLLIEKGLGLAAKYTWSKCALETAKVYENSLYH